MVELVDTLDLKSNEQQRSCGFKSRSEYKDPLYLIDLEGFLFLELIQMNVLPLESPYQILHHQCKYHFL